MAIFAFPIFQDTVWRLTLVAGAACMLGRLHIPMGSALINAYRTRCSTSPLPPPAEGSAAAPSSSSRAATSLLSRRQQLEELQGGKALRELAVVLALQATDQEEVDVLAERSAPR